MRALALAALVTGISAGGAQAVENRHDERLARAAADIVASRMGSLRGSLGFDHRVNVRLPEPDPPLQRERTRAPAAPAAGVWQDGLAVAVERRSLASPDL